MAIEDEMKEYLASLTQQGQLRIGSSMFFCMYVLPHLMEAFRARHPRICHADRDDSFLSNR